MTDDREPDANGYDRTIRQAFELWIEPEMNRRRQAGTIGAAFQLNMAQVVFDPTGGGPSVRLNEEVKGVLSVETARPIEKGELVKMSDIAEIRTHSLTDDDPDAGHFTIIRFKDIWFLSFDFRYNVGRTVGGLTDPFVGLQVIGFGLGPRELGIAALDPREEILGGRGQAGASDR